MRGNTFLCIVSNSGKNVVFSHLNHTQLARVSFSQLSAAVVRHKANDALSGVV